MKTTRRNVLRVAGLAAAARVVPAAAQTPPNKTVTITTSTIMTSENPYAHSAADLYRIWSNVYGTLGRYDYASKSEVGTLAKSWSNIAPTRWRFTLRDDLKRQDGGPGPTSADMVHTWQRTITDPASQQRIFFDEITSIEPVDTLTFDVVTKGPDAQLLAGFFERTVLTSKDLYDKHGADADHVAPFGWGPYTLDSFQTDSRIEMTRNPHWPGVTDAMPARAVFSQIIEAQQRMVALQTGEVQIARMFEPQQLDQLRSLPGVTVLETPMAEIMFLATNSAIKPWDDVRVRQAMAHAVNRDLIIERLLFGLADKMQGAITADQHCYAPAQPAMDYNPERSKQLLKEAGYPNGLDIDFYTASGRYIADRQVAEVVAQMLQAVGFRVSLHAPDYASLFNMIQAGKCGLYYGGRAVNSEPTIALSQYFETGMTKRTNFSNPAVDADFEKIRATFNPAAQCDVVQDLNNRLTDLAPALFMWTHRAIHGVRQPVKWASDPSSEVWLPDVRVV